MRPGSVEWENYWSGIEKAWAERRTSVEVVEENATEQDKNVCGESLPWPYAPEWEREAGDYFPAPNIWNGIRKSLERRAKKGDVEAKKRLEELRLRGKKNTEEKKDDGWPVCDEDVVAKRKVIGACSMAESFDRGSFRDR